MCSYVCRTGARQRSNDTVLREKRVGLPLAQRSHTHKNQTVAGHCGASTIQPFRACATTTTLACSNHEVTRSPSYQLSTTRLEVNFCHQERGFEQILGDSVIGKGQPMLLVGNDQQR